MDPLPHVNISPIRLGLAQALSMLPHSLCEFLCTLVLLYVEDTASLVSSISSGSYNLTILSFTNLSELIAEGSEGDIPFKAESRKVLHFLQIVQLWVSCRSFHPLQEQAFDNSWAKMFHSFVFILLKFIYLFCSNYYI